MGQQSSQFNSQGQGGMNSGGQNGVYGQSQGFQGVPFGYMGGLYGGNSNGGGGQTQSSKLGMNTGGQGVSQNNPSSGSPSTAPATRQIPQTPRAPLPTGGHLGGLGGLVGGSGHAVTIPINGGQTPGTFGGAPALPTQGRPGQHQGTPLTPNMNPGVRSGNWGLF